MTTTTVVIKSDRAFFEGQYIQKKCYFTYLILVQTYMIFKIPGGSLGSEFGLWYWKSFNLSHRIISDILCLSLLSRARYVNDPMVLSELISVTSFTSYSSSIFYSWRGIGID